MNGHGAVPERSPAGHTWDRLLAEADGAPMSEQAMVAWAERLADALPVGAVLALHGELGAGKTTLVRALCARRGVREPEAVTSPTFAILHEYEAVHGTILHADLYRLRTPEELDQLGWDDLLATADLVCVEWPERAGDRLPPVRFDVELSHVPHSATVRTVHLSRSAPATATLLDGV